MNRKNCWKQFFTVAAVHKFDIFWLHGTIWPDGIDSWYICILTVPNYDAFTNLSSSVLLHFFITEFCAQ